MAKKIAQIVLDAAGMAIAATALGHAVHTTDIRAAVNSFQGDLDGYTQSEVEKRVKHEIDRKHTQGTTGTL